MNMRKIIIITSLIIFLILTTAIGYSLMLTPHEQNNKNITINKDINNSTDTIDINNNNQNNVESSHTNNNQNNIEASHTNNNNKNDKEQSVYKTSDGEPRTSHPQSGYSELRQDANKYSDWVDKNDAYDWSKMFKYECEDGTTLYFNK